MPERHHPKRGSHGFSPRKRAKTESPHIKSWAEGGEKPKLQGFFGYKAGMTHAFMIDYGLKRADYITAFVKNIDWKSVENRL